MSNASYWEMRYRRGGTSGAGSRGEEAFHKAEVVNQVIDEYRVKSVLDLGCGDGLVASLIQVHTYTGYDPSPTALQMAKDRMPHRRFVRGVPIGEKFDLILSMDVMFHLVTDEDYREYLALLFSGMSKKVFVYGTDHHQRGLSHVLHRAWTNDIPKEWAIREVPTEFKKAWILGTL